jgi:carboxymethylenebutenolidase
MPMSQKKSQPSNPAAPSYYLAKPPSATDKGVLVLHAWWGLNPFFKGLCERLAQAGFMALAPDLYHGKIAATVEEAEKLRLKLKREVVSQEITQAAQQLQTLCGRGRPRIGVIGFSLGGFWALWLAEQPASQVAATVVFYGSRNGDFTASSSAFQFHLAETDPYVAASGVKKLQKSLKTADKTAEFHTYPGTGHWFFEDDRPDAYDPQAAELAWRRTVEFLNAYIPG